MTQRSVLFINRTYPPVEGATGELLAEHSLEASQDLAIVPDVQHEELPLLEEVRRADPVNLPGSYRQAVT